MCAHPDPRFLSGDVLTDDPGAAAQSLGRAGLLVFALHTCDLEGRCSCPRECSRSCGKHPRTPNGVLNATSEPGQIRAWWTAWPNANVAIATGARSGIVVIDVDSRDGGDETVARLEGQHGSLPRTWAVETGGGGLHLYYRHPGGKVPNSAGALGTGIDVRGDGGYVVAPPSRHRSGTAYRWARGWSPLHVPLASAPAWLVTQLRDQSQSRGACRVPVHAAAVGIPEGQRNSTLTSLAGSMRRRGFSDAAILAALTAENAARCSPPLPEAEVERIVRSISRYALGVSVVHRSAPRQIRSREVQHA